MYRSSLHIGCVVVPCVCVARFGAVVLNVCLSRVCVYLCVCVSVCAVCFLSCDMLVVRYDVRVCQCVISKILDVDIHISISTFTHTHTYTSPHPNTYTYTYPHPNTYTYT